GVVGAHGLVHEPARSKTRDLPAGLLSRGNGTQDATVSVRHGALLLFWNGRSHQPRELAHMVQGAKGMPKRGSMRWFLSKVRASMKPCGIIIEGLRESFHRDTNG